MIAPQQSSEPTRSAGARIRSDEPEITAQQNGGARPNNAAAPIAFFHAVPTAVPDPRSRSPPSPPLDQITPTSPDPLDVTADLDNGCPGDTSQDGGIHGNELDLSRNRSDNNTIDDDSISDVIAALRDQADRIEVSSGEEEQKIRNSYEDSDELVLNAMH